MSHPTDSAELDRPPASSGISTKWWIVGLLMATCFISHMNRVGLSIAADIRLMPRYGIEPVKMGLIYSSFLFVYTIFMIPGGVFIDRVGVRVALALMLLSTALFGGLTGMGGFLAAGHIWLWLMVVRSAMGLCTVPLHPGAARAVGLWIPNGRQTLANGLITGAALLGIACTPPLFGRLIDAVDWPAAFFIAAGCTALLGLTWWIATGRLGSGRGPDSGVEALAVPWGELLRSRSVVLLTLSYSAIGYFQYLFFYWMHYYFEQVLGMGKDESRNFAALPSFAMALTMPLGGWLSQTVHARWGWRSGRVAVAGLAMLAAVIFLVAGVVTKVHIVTVVFFTLAFGSLGLSEAAFWQTAIEVGGPRGGSTAAIMNTGGNGIGLLAPVITPLMAGFLGWQAGIGFGAVVCLLGAVCWLWIRPPQVTNEAENL
jgi:ACS family D-galactonate transporter-like MFS transporter